MFQLKGTRTHGVEELSTEQNNTVCNFIEKRLQNLWITRTLLDMKTTLLNILVDYNPLEIKFPTQNQNYGHTSHRGRKYLKFA